MRHGVTQRITVLVLAVLVTSACGGGQAQPSPTTGSTSAPTATAVNLGEFVVGALFPLSGANAEASKVSRDAVQLAADVLNGAYPAIPITPLKIGTMKITFADTQGNPQVCASEVDRMKASGAVALVGGYGSSETLACSARTEQVGIPYVNGSSSSPALINRGLKWFFHIGPTDTTFTQTYFEWLKTIKAKHPVTKITILNVNTQFGTDAATAIRDYAAKDNIAIVDSIAYDPAAADLSSQVQKLRAGAPDAVFFVSTGPDAVVMLRTMQQLGYTPPALLTYGAFNVPSVLQSAGSLAENVVARSAWSQNLNATNPLSKAVADAYRQKAGIDLAENAARDFEATIAMGRAIEIARSLEPSKIRDALASYSTDTTMLPGGGIKFGPDGQNQSVRALIEQRIGGKYVMLYPTATAEVVWPMPPLK